MTVSCEQQSEYESESEWEDHQQTEGPEETSEVELHELPGPPVNFLSKTFRTRSGRAITLSHRALLLYQGRILSCIRVQYTRIVILHWDLSRNYEKYHAMYANLVRSFNTEDKSWTATASKLKQVTRSQNLQSFDWMDL